MAEKKITLLLYGADRQLWAGGPCTLTVTKVEPGKSTGSVAKESAGR